MTQCKASRLFLFASSVQNFVPKSVVTATAAVERVVAFLPIEAVMPIAAPDLVVAFAAAERIAAAVGTSAPHRTAVERVVAGATIEEVGASTANEGVVAFAPEQHIVARFSWTKAATPWTFVTVEFIVAGTAPGNIVTIATYECVLARVPMEAVVAPVRVEVIISDTAVKRIVTSVARYRIVTRASIEVVVAFVPIDGVIPPRRRESGPVRAYRKIEPWLLYLRRRPVCVEGKASGFVTVRLSQKEIPLNGKMLVMHRRRATLPREPRHPRHGLPG